MNELMIFEGHEVEIIEVNEKFLFNPYHVGECLELNRDAVRKAMSRMNDKQLIKLKNSDVTNCHIRKLNNAGENFITESGVYKLVFKSHKREAEKFTDWVVDEVLPTLRKTGHYSMKSTSMEECIAVAEILTKCSNRRLPMILKVLGKAGFEFDEADTASDAELIDLLNQFSLPQLIKILGLPKSTIHYYRTGQHHPQPDRRRFIINTLKQRM